jgi:hypothetical protein
VYSAKLIVLGQASGFLMLYCIAQNSVGIFGAQQQGLSNALLASCFGALQEKLLKLKVHCEKQFPEKNILGQRSNSREQCTAPAHVIMTPGLTHDRQSNSRQKHNYDSTFFSV